MSTALRCTSLARHLKAQWPPVARYSTPASRRRPVRGATATTTLSPGLLRLLRGVVVAYVPLTAALAVAALVDPRTLLGEPVWVKPLKFSVSIGLNGAALLWLVQRAPAVPLIRAAALLSAVGLAVEQALITLQAARGVRSHFNMDTPFDGAVFAGMGVSLAAGVGVATIALAVAFALRPPQDPVLTRVARSGLGLMLAAFCVGGVMLALGGHSIGTPDGGPGLPLLGWSSVAGDLRPAHFVGLHALQCLILAQYLLRQAPLSTQLAVTRTLAWATGGLLAALTGQALAGAPVLSDSLGLVTGVTVVAAAAGARSAWRPMGRPAAAR